MQNPIKDFLEVGYATLAKGKNLKIYECQKEKTFLRVPSKILDYMQSNIEMGLLWCLHVLAELLCGVGDVRLCESKIQQAAD